VNSTPRRTKLIGVLGGTGWQSTVMPYRLLNQEMQARLGALHSARILLYSIDYAEIRACYSDDWSKIPGLLLDEIRTLLSFSPDCWMIANSTLHKFLDEMVLPAAPPLFHGIELAREHLVARGIRKAMLLGTRFTMEDGYYADPLRAAGIDVVIPAEPDREHIQMIQTKLADGHAPGPFRPYFADLLERQVVNGCEAVIVGCSELSLVVRTDMATMEVVDPLRLQCAACVAFALTPDRAPA
jgi:aspartate racemase